MVTGEEPPARRENGGRRRRWLDGDDDDDDDEEYVAEEEEEEDYAEELSASSAGEEGEGSDAEYEEDEEEEEEVEKPRPKRPVKARERGRKGKADLAAARSRRRKYEEDEDYEEEEVDEDEEIEEYHEEVDEEEEEMPPPLRPKSLAKCGGRGRDVELPPAAERSNQRRRYEEDDDFDPELDDEEDEVDEDIDFDPEADDDDEDEFVDGEEEFGAMRARKMMVKRKSVPKQRTLKKKKKKNRGGSKVSKRKSASAKAKKTAPIRRRRKRLVIDDYEEDGDEDDDDDDFLVEDQVTVNRHPRKKARTGSGRETEVDPQVSVVGEETWPNVESETSDFEFVTSDEEPNDVETPVVEPITVRKGRKKRVSGSAPSSDSEFVLSDKELEDLRDADPPKTLPMLPTQMRRISVARNGEDKGKKKEELEEAGRPICGICLSEEQRMTVQGVLNCCSHYFCFACIMEWSRVESRCPLCKQRFTTITKSSKVDLGLGVRKSVIKVEERDQVYQPTEEEIRRWLDPYENVVCIECNQGGDDSLMLLCDICDSSAHTYCVGLGREVPEGNWYCGGCRLSDEGPSYTRIQHTVGYERQNYINHVDGSSVGFGTAAPSGTFGRSPLINPRRSFQGIDLNLSPREVPGETHPAESQASTDSASTPSGTRATLSGRRQIHRYIRILLTRPRPPSRPDVYPNIAQQNGGVPITEPNRRNFHSSSEANTSQILPDGIQNQRNGLPFVQAHNNFAPCMSLDGDDFQQIEGVKSNLRNV